MSAQDNLGSLPRTAKTRRQPQFRQIYPILMVILGLATYLRYSGLDTPGLWLDEVSYTIAAQRPIFDQIIKPTETLGDYLSVDPTLSDIPFSLSLLLGSANFFVRLPAAIFGILSVALIYRTGRELLGIWPGLIAAFLLCLSSFHILYSQEGRSYSQFIFFSTASFLFLYKAVTVKELKYWGLYALATWAAVSTNHLMIFAVAVQGLFLLLFLAMAVRSQNFRLVMFLTNMGYFCLAVLAVALFRLPWLEDFTQRQCAGCDIGRPSYSLDIWGGFINAIKAFSAESRLVLFVLGSTALIGMVSLCLKNRNAEGLLTIWFFLSIIISTIGLWFISQFYHPRYTIWGLPAYLLLAAYGIVVIANRPVFIKNRPALTALGGCLALIFSLVNFFQIQQNVQIKQRWPLGMLQETTNVIIAGADTGETVIVIGLPRQHLKFYIEQERQDLTFIDERTFAEEFLISPLPDRLAGRWYVLHNASASPNIPTEWPGHQDYYTFYDLLVVHNATPCRLKECVTQTKALLLEIAEANPDSSLAKRVNNVIDSFNVLQLQ
ncbi:MAG: glycosyltransferase family 39 protein [Anaerolineae bacterium]|nr:glycosyltransferase family 39 protein [Anaerolineae bacterium]MCB9108942.1 glycosyltransferase family 39 protein [Anaerolineales bacterium]